MDCGDSSIATVAPLMEHSCIHGVVVFSIAVVEEVANVDGVHDREVAGGELFTSKSKL